MESDKFGFIDYQYTRWVCSAVFSALPEGLRRISNAQSVEYKPALCLAAHTGSRFLIGAGCSRAGGELSLRNAKSATHL